MERLQRMDHVQAQLEEQAPMKVWNTWGQGVLATSAGGSTFRRITEDQDAPLGMRDQQSTVNVTHVDKAISAATSFTQKCQDEPPWAQALQPYTLKPSTKPGN